MSTKSNDVTKIWESLGTFWGQFPQKDMISAFWEAYYEATRELYRQHTKIHLSRSLKYIEPILTYPYSSYEVIFSGDNENIITISGLSTYQIDRYVFSIPTLSGIETAEVLTENIDFQIYDKRYIQFLTTPTYDPSNIEIDNRVTLYADQVYRHNPVLWGIYASGINLPISSIDNEEYLPYNIIETSGINRTFDIAKHYKYLIWALVNTKQSPPTIKNLKRGFGISRGLPFVYREGTVTNIVNNIVSITVSETNNIIDTYIIPSGYVITATSGLYMDKFSLLISGINFYDHVNNYNYIMNLPDTNEFNYTSKVVFTYPDNFNNLNYNEDFHNKYVTSLMPAGLSFISKAE